MYEPAIYTKISGGNNPDAALFAIQTMFLEWTWSPYALYTVATLIFAFAFYNMNLFHSIGSALIPVFGLRAIKYNTIVDIICCFSLVVGMAASLGTGTLTIAGGIQNLFDIKSAAFFMGNYHSCNCNNICYFLYIWCNEWYSHFIHIK